MLQIEATLLAGALSALAPLPGGHAEAATGLPAKVTTVFRATKLHLGDGRMIEGGMLIVEGGVVRRVGKDLDLPQGANLIEHAGSLSPGLIALHSRDGAGSELYDPTRTVMSEADFAFAFNPDHSDFRRCVESGITALVLSPGGVSLVPGATAVVKAAGGRVVKPRAQLVLGFSSRALNNDSFPTSYAGALGEFERLFTDPQGLFSRAASGDLAVLFDVGAPHPDPRTGGRRDEVARALAFAKKHGLKGALYGSEWTEELVPGIQRSGLAVICDPGNAGDHERSVRAVLALAAADVRFGFGLDAPGRNPASLRFAAARAVRAGLDAERALQALTGDAAIIAGVADRIGRIEQGRDADFVLWSGDPLDLSSSVEAVYVDGRRVDGGPR